jgi:hypothetical protein
MSCVLITANHGSESNVFVYVPLYKYICLLHLTQKKPHEPKPEVN